LTIWSAEIKELETVYSSIKGKFPELEKDLEHLIKTDDENVALLYSRRCLEIIVTDLCESELKRPRKTEPLKGIIDKLNREQKVPAHIITSMDHLNSLSTYGTHPKEFDPEQVRPVLINLTTIIKWYLKYLDTQNISQAKPEETIPDIEKPVNIKELRHKPVKRLVLLLSLLLLVVAIVIVALFAFNIISSEKKTKALDKSIAVLPFVNDSQDKENTYFINGIMEEVLLNLQAIKDLRVPGRTSVEQYRNPTKSIPEIAKELGVSYIVEGSGQKYGNTFVLRIQLLEGETDRHLWGDSYEKKIDNIEDIIRIQSQIAQSIAKELKAIITPEEKQLIEKTPTTSLTAYDFYQRGRDEHNKFWNDNDNKTALGKAENLYYKALEYDSAFAKAYSGLAIAYYDRHFFETYFKEGFLDSCLILANIALSFDDQLDEAYYIKGRYYYANGQIEKAMDNYDKTYQINPNYYSVYSGKGHILAGWVISDFVKGLDSYHKALNHVRGNERPSLLQNVGESYLWIGFIDKAKYYFREKLILDGDSANYFSNLAWVEFCIENIENAILFNEKASKIDTAYIPNIDWYNFAGQHQEAYIFTKKRIEQLKKSGELSLVYSHRIGYALWKVGKYEEAEYYFNEQIRYGTESIKLGREIASRGAAYYDLAGVYAFLGDKKKAYHYLDEFNTKNFYPLWLISYTKHDPMFDSIRNEERFQKILQNMEAKYQAEHERVRKWLEENNLL
jgi:TolB-like protein